MKIIEKRNGKMTKREIIRKMWLYGTSGERSDRMALSYVARRLGFDIQTAKNFIMALNRLGFIASFFDKHSVVFYG